jgi:hypothetical protein
VYTVLSTIHNLGFSGFYPIGDLWADQSVIPAKKGIYVVIRSSDDPPVFLQKGAGGFFKQRNPNLPVAELAGRWIAGCKILHVGKAGGYLSSATLRSRIKQYLDFGKGKPVGHRGGRLIWQLEHHSKLLVAWKALTQTDPREEERRLILEIYHFYGQLPFANLRL